MFVARELQTAPRRTAKMPDTLALRAHNAIGDTLRDRKIEFGPGPETRSLADDLAEAFPAVARVVGQSALADLAHSFATQAAGRSAGRFRFGAGFPMYLAAVPALEQAAYLPDLARLEWAIFRANNVRCVPNLSRNDLMLVRDKHVSRLIFTVSPVSHTVASRFPVDRIRSRVLLSGGDGGNVPVAEDAVRLLVYGTAGGALQLRRLSKAEFVFLRVLRAGRTLGEAEQCVASIEPSFNAGIMLLDLIHEGILVELSVGSNFTTGSAPWAEGK